jgi:hypothetical protein
MRLEDMEKISKQRVRDHINACFDEARDAGSDDRRAVLLTEADFYMRELERRRDKRTSTRDLLLEITVIALIGWEIYMGYQQQTHQDQTFKDEKAIWSNMEKSSQATADSLVAVSGLMKTMELSLQKQVELFYDVQLNVIYNDALKKLTLVNSGRTNITVWAASIGEPGQEMMYHDKPIVVAPGNTYETRLDERIKGLSESLPKGQGKRLAFTYFVKNEKHEQFTVAGDLIVLWQGDTLIFNTLPNEIMPGWKKQ